MPRRTKKDLLALVHGHHTNNAEVGESVYIRRDEDEEWGRKYDEGPKSAKAYNYRANRLERHGWVKDVGISDVAPATRAVGTLTETGEKILKAAYNYDDEWEAWNDYDIGTGEFIDRVIEDETDDPNEDSDNPDHAKAAEAAGVGEFVPVPGSTLEDKIAYHDDDYPSDTHGLNYL